MNITDLELAIGQKISASSTNLELLQYARMLQQLQNGAVFAVSTYTSLPTASQNTGKIYLVEDIQTTVYSNGVNWVNLAGRKPLTQVWTWGSGTCGLLGDNTTVKKSSPVREISSSNNWCLTTGNFDINSGLKVNGTLWSWGRNRCGALADNTTIAKSSPVQEITSTTNWCDASAGGNTVMAIKSDGSLWGWGRNYCGSIGDNSEVNRSSPVREASSGTTWCRISVGANHSSALKTDGSLWTWGSNTAGRLGDNTSVHRSSPVREITSTSTWCQVSAGYRHTSAIKNDGSLWSWGNNQCGIIGDNTTITRSSPVQEITGATWRYTSTGNCNNRAIKSNGTLWSWGYNAKGDLGDNTTTSRSSPVQEISGSTLWSKLSQSFSYLGQGIKTDGSLWSWGENSNGGLANNSTVTRSSPVQEITCSTWYSVSGYTPHALKVI